MRHDPEITAQITKLLLQYPELEEDDILRADMIEGETDLHSYLRTIERERHHAEALAVATREVIESARKRRHRFVRRDEALTRLMFNLLQHGNLRRVELPEATLSIANSPRSVVIIDEGLLPKSCIRIKTEPDKIAIKQMLDAGNDVPGACFSNPEPHLTIRTK